MNVIAEFLGSQGQMIFVFALIIAVVLLLYREVFATSVTFLGAISLLGLSGILTPPEVLKTFANEQVAVITMLLIIGKLLKRSIVIESLFEKLFSKTKTYTGFIAKMTGSVALLSGFMNNTPLVALLMPYVSDWGKKRNISPSKLLIPLSYAAIMGGGLTLIGTATNLIVNNIVVDTYGESKALGMFDFFKIGLPLVAAGILFILLFGNKLLPDHKSVLANFKGNSREYLVDLMVGKNSILIGKTIKEASLRSLNELYLVEIVRKNEVLSPVGPKEVLKEGDYLIFAGETSNIIQLVDSNIGLELPNELRDLKEHKEVVEVVIPRNSSLEKKKLKDSNFRARFDSAVIAIRRDGQKLYGKLGEISLRRGDMLLCVAGSDFYKKVHGADLIVTSNVNELKDIKGSKSAIMILGLVAAITLASLKIVPLFTSLIIYLSLLLVTKVVRFDELKKSANIGLIVIMAGALGLGAAMKKTGGAELIAREGFELLTPFGVVGVLVGIYLITNTLSAFITNIAAVSIVLPIALTYAEVNGYAYAPFLMCVAFAGSKNFITPVGYQTNLMVYGPGGYSFKDFMRFGIGLTMVFLVLTVSLIFVFFEF